MPTKCPKCEFENPDGTRFCGNCASALSTSEKVPIEHTETLQAPKEELTTGSTFAGRYQIIEELGKGGMGKVYKAIDKEINAKIALKLIKPEIASDKNTIERFRNELKVARDIAHKNVCRMYDLNKEEGSYYITMEYVSGEDLKSLIRRVKQLTEGTAISIATQVCEGLEEAHRLGVVHRDLKPSNIMIDKNGNARIMDFGIARSITGKGLTDKGIMIGTPEYMSPEQVEGKEVDQRTDIYSLGIILYEMLTGRVPFEGDTALTVAVKHKTETPKAPKEYNERISDDLNGVVLKCLEKDKEKRFRSAKELGEDLAKIGKGVPPTEKVLPQRKTSTAREITRTIKKKWGLIAAFIVVIIIAASATYYFTRGKPSVSPVVGKKRLVVLPFENIGPPEDEYFADGISDEIIARMINVADLSVIARNSAIQYKKSAKSIQQIGEELGVDYVLSGTIRWQKFAQGEDRVRVTPTLSKVSDSTQVWANVYDKSFTEVFQVQSDISKQVVEALGIALLEPEKLALEARPTSNMEAYDYYLRGMDYFYRGRDSEKDNHLAIEMMKKAASLDSSFLQAYAQLAIMHVNYYWYHFDRSEERIMWAKEAAERASQIKGDSAEAHYAWAYYYYYGRLNYDQALKHFDIALKKQPKNPNILLGIGAVKRRQGELAETVSRFIEAAEIDPRSPLIAFNLAESYALMRNYQDAEKWYDRAIFLNIEYTRAYSWKARMFLNRGDPRNAEEVLEAALQAMGELDPHLIIYHWILTDVFDGKYDDALRRLSSASLEAFSDQFYFVPKDNLFGQIYGLMNNEQLAKKHYESAVRLLEAKIKEDPEDSRYFSALGIGYAGLREKDEAIRAALKATEILPISKEAYRGIFRVKDLAQVYTMVGEFDKALDLIEKLLSIPGEMSVPLLRIDPVWRPLLSHPRFQKLANSLSQ